MHWFEDRLISNPLFTILISAIISSFITIIVTLVFELLVKLLKKPAKKHWRLTIEIAVLLPLLVALPLTILYYHIVETNLTEDKGKLDGQVMELRLNIDNLNKEINSLSQNMTSLISEKKQLQNVNDSLEEENSGLYVQYRELEDMISTLKTELKMREYSSQVFIETPIEGDTIEHTQFTIKGYSYINPRSEGFHLYTVLLDSNGYFWPGKEIPVPVTIPGDRWEFQNSHTGGESSAPEDLTLYVLIVDEVVSAQFQDVAEKGKIGKWEYIEPHELQGGWAVCDRVNVIYFATLTP